jgi:DNA-binding LacI/PurR family transcriptional regulator
MLARLFDSAHQLNIHIRFFSFFDAFKDPVFFNKNIHSEEISALLILMPLLIKNDSEAAPILREIMERIDTILCLEKSIYNLPALEIDLNAASRIATKHLIELNHKRIGFLSLDDERDYGYRQTLQEYDLPVDDALIHKVDATRLYESAYKLTGELLSLQPAISAIFCANDDTAVGAISRIHASGLKIPDDISIVSIDDSRISSVVHPPLTTVRLPFEYIGTHALVHLQLLRACPDETPASVMLPLELIVRQSTGIARL